MPPSIIALIPARSGSKRLPDKNVLTLAGQPMLAYTIAAARESGVFDAVVISTDAPHYAEIGERYGAEVPFLRPAELAGDLSPDIEWVAYTLRRLQAASRHYDCFSILRPTSPFRQAETIQRAWQAFLAEGPQIDSLRAVEPSRQHPGKMWVVRDNRLLPLLPFGPPQQPWHSSQTQSLPKVYVQNASLEIAWSRVVFDGGTISGTVMLPFFTEGFEGFDVNYPLDLMVAEMLLQHGSVRLPAISPA